MHNVLVICTSGYGSGGVTRHLLNYLSRVSKDPNLSIWVGHSNYNPNGNLEKFEKIGCRLQEFPKRTSSPMKYVQELYKFLHKNNIDIIHVHGSSSTMLLELIAAKLAGVKVRIIQSHNTCTQHAVINALLKPMFSSLITHRLACGEAAGKYMFGNKSFQIIPNGIDCNEFIFNREYRDKHKSDLGLNGKKVLGHVGLYRPEKNHTFILDIFDKLTAIDQDWVLMLFGRGDLEESIKEKVKILGLSDKVLFMGIKDNVNEYLSAMDVFLFPSLYEGLPFSVLEAQANGLPCVLSDTITRQINVTGNVEFLSLQSAATVWAEAILDCYKQNHQNREAISKQAISMLIDNHYDIDHEAPILSDLYKG